MELAKDVQSSTNMRTKGEVLKVFLLYVVLNLTSPLIFD